jgi:hypothetical protein
LYNIADDPYESDDLSEKYPDKLFRMKSELQNWFEEVEKERKDI